MIQDLNKNKRIIALTSIAIVLLSLVSGSLFVLKPGGTNLNKKAKAAVEVRKPTTAYDTVGLPNSTDLSNSIDADSNTYSSTNYGINSPSANPPENPYGGAILFGDWETPTATYSDLTLYVKISDTGPALHNKYTIRFTNDLGATWYWITKDNYGIISPPDTKPKTYSFNFTANGLDPSTQDFSKMSLRLITAREAGFPNENKNILFYDIWTEGTFNQAPSVAINSVSQILGSNDITIDYNVIDPEQGTCSINLDQFDIGSGFQNMVNIGGDNLGNLACSPSPGTPHTLIWSAGSDVPGTDVPNALIKLRANDGIANGAEVISPGFSLDTSPPIAPGNLVSGPGDATSSSITLHLPSGSPAIDSHFSTYKLFYKATPPPPNVTDVVSGSNFRWTDPSVNFTLANFGGANTTTVTGLNPSTTYYFNIWAYDVYGNKVNASEISNSTNAGNSAPNISSISASQQSDDGFVNIAYTLQDGESNSCNLVNYEYSTNGSSPWYTMTPATGDVEHNGIASLSSSPAGINHIFVWNALNDLPDTSDGEVYVRLKAYDGTDNGGFATTTFSLDLRKPIITGVTASQAMDGSKLVTINYNLSDDTGSWLTTEMLISQDEGATWNVATTSTTGDIGYPVSTGGKTSIWDAGVDFSNHEISTMYIKIRAKDAFQNRGNYSSIASFDLDTSAPAGLASPSTSNITSSSMLISWPPAVTDGNFANYTIWYGTNQAEVESRSGSALSTQVANRTTTSKTVAGLDSSTTYYFKIWAKDTFGNESTVNYIFDTTIHETVPPPTLDFGADPSSIDPGGSSTLTWSSSGADSCTATGDWPVAGDKDLSGSEIVSPTSDATYSLECFNFGGSSGQQDVTVTIIIPPPALAFSADPLSIVRGNNSTLSWTVSGATSCTASGDWSGSQDFADGTYYSEVSPTSNATYILECFNGVVSSGEESVSITVTNPPSTNPPASYSPPPQSLNLPSNVVTPSGGGTIEKNGVKVDFPQGTVSSNTAITINILTSAPKDFGEKVFVKGADLSAKDYITNEVVRNFDGSINVIFHYNDTDITGVDELSLRIYYYNESLQAYIALPTVVDIGNNTATASTNHFSTFVLWGDKKAVTPTPNEGGTTENISQPIYRGGQGGTVGVMKPKAEVKEEAGETPILAKPIEYIQSIYNNYYANTSWIQIVISILLALLILVLLFVAYQIYKFRNQFRESQERLLKEAHERSLREAQDRLLADARRYSAQKNSLRGRLKDLEEKILQSVKGMVNRNKKTLLGSGNITKVRKWN